MATRTSLKLLTPAQSFTLHAFCARCGAPPAPRAPGQSTWRESRVCAHCGLGLVLRTPLAVARDSPFLVVDRELNVSAVSRRAEDLLGVSERRAVGLAIERLLAPAEQPQDFGALLRDALLGGGASEGVRCWIGEDRGATHGVRVGPCGPPPGALIVLDPPTS